MAGLGEWVEDRARELAELFANFVIHAIAERSKVTVLSVAHAVPGFCHTHLPTDDLVQDCVYCQHVGNAFADKMPPRSAKIDPTLLDEFQTRFSTVLLEFADKVLEVVKKNGVAPDADAVRELVHLEVKKRFFSGDEAE